MNCSRLFRRDKKKSPQRKKRTSVYQTTPNKRECKRQRSEKSATLHVTPTLSVWTPSLKIQPHHAHPWRKIWTATALRAGLAISSSSMNERWCFSIRSMLVRAWRFERTRERMGRGMDKWVGVSPSSFCWYPPFLIHTTTKKSLSWTTFPTPTSQKWKKINWFAVLLHKLKSFGENWLDLVQHQKRS